MNDAKPSKSSRKREYLKLQALGEQLIPLSREQLSSIGTDEYLVAQVLEAKTINSNGALRRQKQLIGKIMRDVDPEPIRAALKRFGHGELISKTTFKQSERWRDRIAAEGKPALGEFEAQTGRTSEALRAQLIGHDAAVDSVPRQHIKRQMFKEIHRILLAEV